MSDRFKQLPRHARDWVGHGLAPPLARINVLVRDMTHLLRDREPRPVVKGELTKAVAMREKLRRYPCWS